MKHEHRLRASLDFRRVVRDGRSVAAPTHVLYHLPRDEHLPPRVGIAVSRRIGAAVVRNRTKRLLREAVRPLIRQLRGCDIVVVARPGAGEVGMAALREALEASAARAGLLDRTGRGTST